MKAERREELRQIHAQDSEAFGDLGPATITRRELRALLESDEALDRVKGLPNVWRRRCAYTPGDPINTDNEHIRAEIDTQRQACAEELGRAISGDGGKEEG